jgi:hypothetical protein
MAYVTTTAVVSALAMLILASSEAKAGAHESGMQSNFRVGMHSSDPRSPHHHLRHRRPFVQWPLYGYYFAPPYTLDDEIPYSPPEVVPAPEPPPAVGCQHSQQTVKVPSENGQTREVTILGC